MKTLTKFLLIALLCSWLTPSSFGQTDEECMMCHEDPGMKSERTGESVFVKLGSLKKSAHTRVACISCHKDAAGEIPHAEKLKPIDCGSCHTTYEQQVQNDIHHKLFGESSDNFPTCKICHGNHDIQIPSAVEDKSKNYCGKCHTDDVLSAPYHTKMEVNETCKECHDGKDYRAILTSSVHGQLACSNCHGYVVNNIDDHAEEPKDGRVADCYLCHHLIAEEHRESIHGISLAEGINEAAQCWDCHGSHDVSRLTDRECKVGGTNLVQTCGNCHDDLDFIKEHSLTIQQPAKLYSTSVHGVLLASGNDNAACCTDCHGVHNIKNRVQQGSTIASVNVPETCANCHKEIVDEYKKSIHWIGVRKGIREAPTCNDCHSEHSIHAINTVNKRDEIMQIQENTCLHCHESLLMSERYGIEAANAKSYKDSYHGLAVRRGDEDAAMCIDCHGVHNILPKSHEGSAINEANVTATCAKCHEDATPIFSQSYSHITDLNTEAGYIEDLIETVYFWLIIIVIGGMAVHNLIIFVYDLRQRQKERNKQIVIPRFTTNELIQHYVLLISFIVLAITGFQLKFPDSWWSEGLTSLGLDEITRQYTHRTAAVIMTALSLWHFFFLIFTARGRSVLRSLLPRISDLKHAIQNVMYYLKLSKKHPYFDNHNYIEKAEYWALIWGTIVMGTTGLILWFPTLVGDWAPVWTIKVSEIVHYYEAILASLAIIVWHWFFVIFRPQEYPLSFTCIDGKMTITHYKDEHKKRFDEIIIEWLRIEKGELQLKKSRHITRVFVKAIEKNGINMNDFVSDELTKDQKLMDRAKELGLI